MRSYAISRRGRSAAGLDPAGPGRPAPTAGGLPAQRVRGDRTLRDRKAYDLLVQAEAGVLAVTGSPDAPAKAGISVADIACGMYAYSAVLAALLRRERTGRGDVITISLLDALAEWMSHPLLATRLTPARPRRGTGARHATIVPYGGYQTADGQEIMLAVQNEGEWNGCAGRSSTCRTWRPTRGSPGTSAGWPTAPRPRSGWRGRSRRCPPRGWWRPERPGSRTRRCARWPTR